MSTRNITLLTRQSNQPSSTLPSSARTGEGLINTADGKLFYKGFISGTGGSSTYVSSFSNAQFFEVGSHLSQLFLDGGIIAYSGLTNLSGKFLSGTTNGFVLSDVSSISGANTYVTATTYNQNTGILSTYQNDGSIYTAGTWNYVSATTLSGNILTVNKNGGTPVQTTINAVTGGTYANGVISLSGTGILGSITGLTSTNIFDTGFTYNNANTFIITNNTGGTLNASINIVTGLTVNGNISITGNTNISGNTNVNGNITGSNLLTTPSGSAFIGTGGLIVGSGGSEGVPGVGDVVINGSLTVFGTSISAFTGNLYIEDNLITINYNPTGNTYNSSLGAGLSVQNGLGVNGITGDTVYMEIAQTDVPITMGDAYSKRFWETNLFNLMLGSSGGTGTGNYVLQSNDILNGGTY